MYCEYHWFEQNEPEAGADGLLQKVDFCKNFLLPIAQFVDDEEVVRNVFSESLSHRYECATAANAQEALDLLAQREFALALSDVQMPGLSGVELLRKIVSDFPDVAVIMVSGVGRSQRVRDALRIGAFDYLIKWCDLDVLQMSVERALERRALARWRKIQTRPGET